MSTFLTLDQNEIATHIPHRFENMMLDSIDIDRSQFLGHPHLHITENDRLHRQLFFQTLASGERVLMSAISMEIVALASIVSTGQLPPGHLAFFAMISNFSRTGHARLGDVISGEVLKVRDRGGFLAYKGNLKSNNTPICTGDVMAFYADVSQGMPAGEKKEAEIPTLTQNTPIDKNSWHKAPAMVFCDAIRHLADDFSQIVTEYSFPADHPTAQGHFPGNPVMMGVFQWTSVEDAFSVVAKHLRKAGKSGRFVAHGSANLVSAEGHMVAECKEIAVELVIGSGAQPDYADILETRRFAFKNIVYPNNRFYTILDIASIDAQ